MKRNKKKIQTSDSGPDDRTPPGESRICCRDRTCPLVFIAVALFLRLAHYYFTRDTPYFSLRIGDEAYYHEWAHGILSSQGLRHQHVFFTSPLYAYFLAGVYYFFGDGIGLVKFFNALLGLGGIIFSFLAARLLVGRSPAKVTLAALAFSFGPIFYESFAEKTAFVFFLTALAVFLSAEAFSRKDAPWMVRVRRWLLAGLAGGAAALAHPTLFLLPVSVITAIAVNMRKDIRGALRESVPFALGVFLAVTPATIHNWITEHDFVPISYSGGTTFYIGNHKLNPDGAYWSPPFQKSSDSDSEEKDFRLEAELRLGRNLKPSEISSYFFMRGLDEMAENPRLALSRIWNRLRWVFTGTELMDSRCVEFYKGLSPVLSLPVLLKFSVIAFFGILGLFYTLRQPNMLFLNIFVVLYAASYSLFLVFGRYRLPLLVPLSITSCAFLEQLRRLPRPWPLARTTSLILLMSLVAYLINSPTIPVYMATPAVDFYNMGVHYLREEKNTEKATAEFGKAISISPDFIPAAGELAKLYLRAGKFKETIPLYEKALLRAEPSSWNWNNYGIALASTGETRKAAAAFENALRLDPASEDAKTNLRMIKRLH